MRRKEFYYDPIKVYEETDLPFLGVNSQVIKNYLGGAQEYDLEQPISASRALATKIPAIPFTGYPSASATSQSIESEADHVSNTFKTLPKPYAPWRMSLPNTTVGSATNTEIVVDGETITVSGSDNRLENYSASLVVTELGATEITNINPNIATITETEYIDYSLVPTDTIQGTEELQTIPLSNGFNLFSTYIDVPVIDMFDFLTGSLYNTTTNEYVSKSTLQSANGPVLVLKNSGGGVLGSAFTDPTFNGIGDYLVSEGYQIKMDGDNYELRISGSAIVQRTFNITRNLFLPFASSTAIDPEVLFADQLTVGTVDPGAPLSQDNPPNIRRITNNAAAVLIAPFDGVTNIATTFNAFGDLLPGESYLISCRKPFDITFENDFNIPGCTNPNATNYDANATVDDGSCIIPGCTDEFAANYNADATVDDGTCNYPTSQASSQFITLPPFSQPASTNTFYISTNRNLPAANFLAGTHLDIQDIFDAYLFDDLGNKITAEEIEELVKIVQDDNGTPTYYFPDQDFNSIENMQPAVGYKVSLNSERADRDTKRYELRIPGVGLTSYTYELVAGWNYIGVPFEGERTVLSVFGNIEDKVVLMKNSPGDIWSPEFGYDGIGTMKEGEGYLIKVTEAVNVVVNF